MYSNLFNKFIFLFEREGAFTARANMIGTGNSLKRIKHLSHTICKVVFPKDETPDAESKNRKYAEHVDIDFFIFEDNI